MRITGNSNNEIPTVNRTVPTNPSIKEVVKQESQPAVKNNSEANMLIDNSEEAKAKVKEVVTKMNDMLDATNSKSKFMYHDGLERYYVTVVDRETDEVVKEIPPRKLLDAYYEMQKMLGMVVDEKI